MAAVSVKRSINSIYVYASQSNGNLYYEVLFVSIGDRPRTVNTVEPPLTAISPQWSPLYKDHFLSRQTFHTLALV